MDRRKRGKLSIKIVLGGGALGTALFSVDAARAGESTWLSTGPVVSIVTGDSPATGLGGELTVALMPSDFSPVVGGFGQAQAYLGDEPAHGRFAFGMFAGTILGLELGMAHRTASEHFDSTTGLHIAPYFSLVVFSIATRWTVPLRSDPAAHGAEFAVSFALKFPFKTGGQLSFSHGRPLRVETGREPALAKVGSGAGWSRHAAKRPSALPDAERSLLAQRWLADARAEHASVAAFARLSLELMALGAPAGLVARTHRAALEEVEHARLCFALASKYGGAALAPGELPEAGAGLTPSYRLLAVDAFLDGCLGEGAAVARARVALKLAGDRGARRALEVIVRDEARHAALAWDVLQFALAHGGAEVAAALREVAARPSPIAAPARERRVRGELEHHGQPRPCWYQAPIAAARRRACARLDRLLARAEA